MSPLEAGLRVSRIRWTETTLYELTTSAQAVGTPIGATTNLEFAEGPEGPWSSPVLLNQPGPETFTLGWSSRFAECWRVTGQVARITPLVGDWLVPQSGSIG